MNLENFIEQTLTEIFFGIHRAKIASKDLVAIAPGTLNGERQEISTDIQFDIAVTVAEETESNTTGGGGVKAGISVLGANVSAGGAGEKATSSGQSHQQVSRIVFSVPVHLNANYRNDAGFKKEMELLETLLNSRANSKDG